MSERHSDPTYPIALLALVLSGLNFFLIILWWLSANRLAKVEVDVLSWSLSVLQTLIAMGAFAGFWLVRGAAVHSAREMAKDIAEKEAKQVAEPVARRTAEEFLTNYFPPNKSGAAIDIADALDGGEDSNG